MKRVLILIAAILLLSVPAARAESGAEWNAAPVITKAYELSAGELYLEWQGNAPVYQVYMDGKSVADVIVNNAVIPVKKGTHNILVYPISESKSADTKLDLGLNIGGDSIGLGGNLGLDLGALGLDPKKLAAGNPSEPLHIDYTADPIYNASPEELAAETDFGGRVHLSFTDRYNADEYLIAIKKRKDVNYIRFNIHSEEAEAFVSKANSVVTLILDQDFLWGQGCMIPELDEKYSFTVQLRKYAVNMLNGEKEPTVIHESKASRGLDYTLTAPWKNAPVMTYASQTADGQITLRWDHDDGDLNCEYMVLKINKTLGIRTGEEIWGVTTDNEYVVNDLMNGGYSIAVTPRYQGERGNASQEVWLEIRNDWVAAPVFSCVQTAVDQVRLTWPAAAHVETYHVTVYAGNSRSLLRFVNLDYRKYAEIDLPSDGETMEYLFVYGDPYDADAGLRLKFEIYGVRHTAGGAEQKSAVSAQTIRLR